MRIDEMAERIVKKNKLLAPPAAAAAAAEAATENGDEPAQEQQTQLAHVGMPTQVRAGNGTHVKRGEGGR